MYNDPYNPELDPSKNPELAGETTNDIAPGWEDVAAEADSPDAPPAFGSLESYQTHERLRHGTIGEDLDALRTYVNHTDTEGPQTPEQLDETTDDSIIEEKPKETKEDSSKELDEAEVEARLRDYIMSLESEFNNVRNMSSDGLRRRISEERRSLEQQLSGPDASTDRTLRIDLAVRQRAEAILRNSDQI